MQSRTGTPDTVAKKEAHMCRVNWKDCSDRALLKEISVQGNILKLITDDTCDFKEEVYSNGYNRPEEEEETVEEEVSLEELEAEVTAMHTMTMTRMPTDSQFLSQLAALRADGASSYVEEEED